VLVTRLLSFRSGRASDFAPGAPCEGALFCTQPSSIDSAGHVVIGQTELNPANTIQNAYFQVGFDHELGHGEFGLNDCENCQTAVTIMADPATQMTDPRAILVRSDLCIQE
jgi:hypothetical protein